MTNRQNDLAARLSTFTDVWRQKRGADTLVSRLARFLDSASPIISRPIGAPVSPQLCATRLVISLAELLPALRTARTTGAWLDPWAISGVRALEVRNSAVLAALWNPALVGDVATRFLGAFLDQLRAEHVSLPRPPELACGYHVRAEHCPDDIARDRVDIVIETTSHLIGIEIKIGAGLGKDQLERYDATISRLACLRCKVPVIIFLAPFDPKSTISHLVLANWAMIRSAVEAALPRDQKDYGFPEHLIASFARHTLTY